MISCFKIFIWEMVFWKPYVKEKMFSYQWIGRGSKRFPVKTVSHSTTFLLKLLAIQLLKENLVLKKDASLTVMENEGSIVYSQGMSFRNKKSPCMVKRVRTYCLICIGSTHMLDDGKKHMRHTQCPLNIKFFKPTYSQS